MNGLRFTVGGQMINAKKRARRLCELGRISEIDVRLFDRKADDMLQFLNELDEREVAYGEASGDQADQQRD